MGAFKGVGAGVQGLAGYYRHPAQLGPQFQSGQTGVHHGPTRTPDPPSTTCRVGRWGGIVSTGRSLGGGGIVFAGRSLLPCVSSKASEAWPLLQEPELRSAIATQRLAF
jgi:hypothetical protein